MGNFYKNVTVKGPAREAILAWLRQEHRTAYVSPTLDGCTVIFDRRCDGEATPDELRDLTLSASKALGCAAIGAAVYDEDVLLLSVAEKGEARFTYASSRPKAIQAELLCNLFQPRASMVAVWLILAAPHFFPYVTESFRHAHLASALGLPLAAVSTGYEYLTRGELPEGLAAADLQHT